MEAVRSTTVPLTLWGSVREALRGSRQDFTAVNLDRAILLLSIPMVLEMVLQSLFAVVNVFWVARLGAHAVAAVGLTEAILSLVFAVSMGLSLSTTAMVARRIGEKDRAGAGVAAVQAITLGVGASLVIGIPSLLAAPHLLRLMGASPEVLEIGTGYVRVALASSGVALLLSVNNAIFRGAGDAALAMRVLWMANLVNLVLDPFLIFGIGPFPELGVTGAAVATLTSRSLGVGFQVYLLVRGTERIRILSEQLRWEAGVFLRLLRVSTTGLLQFIVPQVSWLGIVRIVSFFGADAVAACTIAIRVMVFFILPSWGLNRAAATLVGQNLGAKRPDRAESSVWRAGLYNMLFLGTVGVLMVVYADPVVRMFTQDPAVAPLAATYLRILSYGNIAYAYGMVILQAFNGAGDTVTPTLVVLFGCWLLEIPLAYWLAIPAGMESEGVFIAHVAANAAIAAASVLLFRRGSWKQKKI